ncbi:hypothetical protein, partial [Yersinia mollaretii]|uniref:hypothetical protein n=1 Tax=Yersinia mollaretii TaxID=33060 RepID=UPI001C98C565
EWGHTLSFSRNGALAYHHQIFATVPFILHFRNILCWDSDRVAAITANFSSLYLHARTNESLCYAAKAPKVDF